MAVVGYEVSGALRAAIKKEVHRATAEQYGLPWALGVERLYKFKGFAREQREHVADLLKNARVYFASPEQFNDPYDVAPVLRLAGDPPDPAFLEELERVQLSELRATGASEDEIAERRRCRGTSIDCLADAAKADLRHALRGSLRILCLTAEQCHPLQWAHYADQHRGLCLHFSCEPGGVFGGARQVAYRAARSPILIPIDRQTDDEVMERMALVKADFWAYEREFRLLAGRGLDRVIQLRDNYAGFSREDLAGITVGMRMPDSDRQELIQLVNAHHPGLPIWACVEDSERFWMRVERIR